MGETDPMWRQPGPWIPFAEYVLVATVFVLSFLNFPASGQDVIQMQGPPSQSQMQAYNLMQQGMAKLQAKQPSQALPLLQQAAGLWPEMPHVHYYLGFAYQDSGNYAAAIPEFQRAIESDAKRVDCMINIATCYQLKGQPARAADWYEDYLKRQPGSPKAGQIRQLIPALRQQAAKLPGGGQNDPDYLASVAGGGALHRWPVQRLPLKVYISNGVNSQGAAVRGFLPEYNQILVDSLNEWMQASGGKLSYVLVNDANRADIVFIWTDDASLRSDGGNEAEQGVALRNEIQTPQGFEIQNAKVAILVFGRDTGTSLSKEKMKFACLHEIGHALGLAGHSGNNQDAMFYSELLSVIPSLSARDRATISRLYAQYPSRQAMR